MIKKIFILYLINAFILAQLIVGGDTELKFGESKNNYNFSEVFLNLSISGQNHRWSKILGASLVMG